ncbi:hypothetical protein OXV60_18670 [Bacteroides uniformis]|nr:hypothetical protein [Bacteroides uniformis]MCY6321074.1 hypothetical protein [Bacteroides uniformis]
MNNIFTICYSEEEANEIGHFILSRGYEGVQMIAIDIVVKRFGGLSKKLKGIIQITSVLALQVAK